MGVYDVDDFERQVIERSREIPVLVDFWAEWCGPCRTLGPVLEKLAAETDGRWELAKLDTEAHQPVAMRYGIRGIPAVKLFVDGEVVDEFVGALPESQVLDFLDRALPSPRKEMLDRARKLAVDGDREAAIELLDEILEMEPADLDARIELARQLIWQEPERAAALVEGIGLGSDHADAADGIRSIAHLFSVLDEPDDLPQSPVRTSYLAAIAALRGGDLATALDGFITVIDRDRAYDEDGARQACLAIFQLLGPDDEVTRTYRPLFASAVYA